MYNVRYHIASLVGVFLALALGLILGGLVVQRGTIDQQEGALVAGLQKEFSTLRSENAELSQDNQRLSAFSSAIADEWVEGRLDGRTIVVIARSPREPGVDDATKAIESAGGRVAIVTLLRADLALDDSEVRSQVSSAATAAKARGSIAASLSAEWFDARSDRALTEALSNAGVLRLEGLEPGTGVGGIVDIAATKNEPDPSGVAIMTAFKGFGPVVGAQTKSAGNGVAAAAHRAGAGALDTLDTPIGHYSLVALLTGAKAGYYGLAEQATALYPAFGDE